MKKLLLYISVIFSILSCGKGNIEKKIDDKFDQEIIKIFDTNDKHLWNTLENEFYKRVFAESQLSDTLQAIQIFHTSIMSAGVPQDFYLDEKNSKIQNFIQNLEKIGLNKNDECAHRFLHNISKPIVEEYENKYNILLDSTNIIRNYAYFEPDSIPCGFEISQVGLSEKNNLVRAWENSGSRKIILLLYMIEMMNGKAHTHNNG